MSDPISHARFLEVRERRRRLSAALRRPPVGVPNEPTVSPDLPVTIVCEAAASKASIVVDQSPTALVH